METHGLVTIAIALIVVFGGITGIVICWLIDVLAEYRILSELKKEKKNDKS